MILIKNARLIKELTEGYEGQMADVLVNNNRIKKIEQCGLITVEENVLVIDAEGNTLMPGLWDLHAHLSYRTQTSNTDTLMNDLGEELFGCYRYAKQYMKHGYTTVRDCGSAKETVLFVRDAINRGDIKGPRIIACGLIITPTTKGNKMFPDIYAEADSPEAVRRAARVELSKGADFLKFMATGAFMNKGGQPGLQIAIEAEIKSIQEIAELGDSYVAVHCHNAEAIEKCIEIGIRTIEHASFISDKGIEMLKENDKSFIIPTLSVCHLFLNAIEKSGVNEFMDDGKKSLAEYGYECIRKAYEAGLKMGWGSDIGMHDLIANPGLEFIARKEHCGFSNIDLLLQATKYSAEIAGYGEEVGTVEAGKIADLIIVDGNPDEDINVMCKDALHVIRDGEKLI